MNALPSFNPPPQSRKSRRRQSKTATTVSSRRDARVKSQSNPAYAHRRQGLEAAVRLATYSALSIFGMVTLVNLLSYNWSQQPKLQHIETELKDAKARTQATNNSFNRSFDLRSQKSVMQENSYKFAADRSPIIIVTPEKTPDPATK
jgi:hypothetical protein